VDAKRERQAPTPARQSAVRVAKAPIPALRLVAVLGVQIPGARRKKQHGSQQQRSRAQIEIKRQIKFILSNMKDTRKNPSTHKRRFSRQNPGLVGP